MKRYPVIHPFLFAIYPVLSVLAASLPVLSPIQAIRPAIIYLLVSGIILVILYWLYKDWYRAGFLASMVVIMLFYYGYSYRLPREIQLFNLSISRHILIICFWVVFLGFLSSKWLWQRVRPHVITNFMNISSGLALLYAIYMLAAFWFTSTKDPLVNWSRPPNPAEDGIRLAETHRPDIYYIILDGYARSDILQDIYHYDNSDFIDALKSRGFYVAEDSRSNYTQTDLSLASSLNLEYLDYLSFAGGKSMNREPLMDMVLKSRVRGWLEEIGYKIYLSGEYYFAEKNDPALVFSVPKTHRLTTLESLLLGSSMFEILVEEGNVDISSYTFQAHRERVMNGFSTAKYLATKEGPKYVFAHIIAPHPPFVFDQDGNPVQPDVEYKIFDGRQFTGGLDAYINGYQEQLAYIDTLVLDTIDDIQKKSLTPPIIILQSDHGPAAFIGDSLDTSCLKERFSILNAYYFPDGNTDVLYPSITPVNTFRVIFDKYFGTGLQILPDQNYYSIYHDPYKYTDVTSQVDRACQLSEQP
jgi:hypothetical protein